MTDIAIGLGAKVAGGLLKAAPAILGAAAVFSAGAVCAWKAPFFGAGAQIASAKAATAKVQAVSDTWQRAAQQYQVAFAGERAAFAQSEVLRGQEQQQAIAGATAAVGSCDARVALASRSASAIQTLISKEPAHDPNGCPVRELVPLGELRDALRPAAPPGGG